MPPKLNSSGPPLTLELPSGGTIRVNDHVFCETPFIGHAWAVGRVMELLGPAPLPAQGAPSSSKDGEMRVKLAVYLRYARARVTGRRGKDDRLLYTAFKSFIHPLSNLRGKCYVKHKSHIDDLTAWRKEPNHFYFERLYDEYLKREYDVVAIKAYRNLPEEIRAILATRYSFLVCEKEAFGEYSVEFQSCRICATWASPPDSVRCSICAESYHMTCCNPRVASKPIRGYSWTCAPCYLQHEQDVDNHRQPAKPKLERALKAAEQLAKVPSADKVLRTFRGWPMRYLGQYSRAEDAVDADDGIFPRSASRVGSKFQATWLPEIGDQDRPEGIFDRGSDETAELQSQPSASVESIDWFVYCKPPPPCKASDIGVIEQVLRATLAFDTAQGGSEAEEAGRKALMVLNSKPPAFFDYVAFSDSEMARLVNSLNVHHGLDSHDAALATGRSAAQCVRKYREWKAERLRDFFASATGATVEPILFPSESLLTEKDLVYSPADKGATSCSACASVRSGRWWTMIQEDYDGVYCDTCHDLFKRYGQIPKRLPVELPKLSTKAVEKQKMEDQESAGGPPSKKQRLGRTTSPKSSSKASPIPPPQPVRPPPKPLPCALCKIHEPAKNPVIRCLNCAFSVHPSCYGVPDGSIVEPDWLCELCFNTESEQYRRVPRCVLCPGTWKLKGPPPIVPQPSHLHALKPTLDGNWAHLYCSVFQPATYFSDPAVMKLTEGVHLAERAAWTTPCTICHRAKQGAVVPCSDCHDVFHVACAHKTGYTLGMEISLVKSSRKDVSVVKFQEERGIMHPRIVCKKHDVADRLIYPLHDRDATTGLTALETFVDTYKQPPVGLAAFPLLRRAEALERLLPAKTTSIASAAAKPKSKPPPACASCQIGFSPLWHPAGDDAKDEGATVCNRCHLRASSTLAPVEKFPSAPPVEVPQAAPPVTEPPIA